MKQTIQIKISALGDPPIFTEHKDAIDAKIIVFSILEGGMQSGKTSCGIFFEMDGKKGFAQLSAEMFESLSAAVRGAVERFETPKKN